MADSAAETSNDMLLDHGAALRAYTNVLRESASLRDRIRHEAREALLCLADFDGDAIDWKRDATLARARLHSILRALDKAEAKRA